MGSVLHLGATLSSWLPRTRWKWCPLFASAGVHVDSRHIPPDTYRLQQTNWFVYFGTLVLANAGVRSRANQAGLAVQNALPTASGPGGTRVPTVVCSHSLEAVMHVYSLPHL